MYRKGPSQLLFRHCGIKALRFKAFVLARELVKLLANNIYLAEKLLARSKSGNQDGLSWGYRQ